MRVCAYCGRPIEGEALEIVPVSGRGGRPTAYWHKKRADCAARPVQSVSAPDAR